MGYVQALILPSEYFCLSVCVCAYVCNIKLTLQHCSHMFYLTLSNLFSDIIQIGSCYSKGSWVWESCLSIQMS